jgi:hypothetical protein
MPMNPQLSRAGLRRLCALVLVLLSVGPWLMAFSSPDSVSEASLPACCRTHGKHKCLMRFSIGKGAVSTSAGIIVSQVSERCPYSPAYTTAAHSDPFGQPENDMFRGGPTGTSSYVVTATRRWKFSRSRANCMRGPPSPALSLKAMTDRLAAQQRLPNHWRHDVSIETDILTLFPGPSSGLDTTA